MANISKTVEIIFGGKNEVSGAVNDIIRQFDNLEKSVSNIATPLAGIGAKVLELNAALGALAIAGMATAIKAAGEFGGKFGEITTLIGATGAPIETFKTNILDYSTTSVKSITQIEGAIYSAISAGVDYKSSIEFVAAAEKLAVAGRADLGQTTTALVSVLNAYGASTSEASKYSDILFTTVRLGQTTVEQLGGKIAQVTGIASAAGIPFDALSAAIAALTVSGLPTEQAITGLKAAISNIIKPSSEAEKAAAALGIQFDASALKTKGLEGVLWDAYKATGGNVTEMGKLFGSVEGLNVALVLGADKTGKYKDAMTAMGDASGSTATAYEKVAGSFENSNQRMANSFKVALIEIGDKLMPEYGKIAGSLGDLFAGLRIGVESGAFDPLFVELGKVSDSISKWISAIGKALPDALKDVDFTAVTDALGKFRAAFDSAFSDATGDPEKLGTALQTVVDSIGSLMNVTYGIVEAFAPIITVVKEAVTAFNNLDSDTKVLTGNVLGLSMVFKTFGPIGLILVALGTDAETTASVFQVAFGSIENGINAMKVAVLSLAMVFAQASDGMAALLGYVPGYDNTKDLERTGDRVKIIGDLLDEAQTKLAVSSMKVMDAMTGTGTAAKTAESKANEYSKTIDKIPSEKKTDLNVTTQVGVDEPSVKLVKEILHDRLPDGTLTTVEVWVEDKSLNESAKKIDEKIPKEKKVDISLETTRLKEQSEIVQKQVEWQAKLNIAQVEAATQTIKSMFTSIDGSIKSTGDVMMAGFEALTKPGPYQDFIKRQIEDEAKRREQTFDLQKDIVSKQSKLLELKIAALERGDNMIQIQADGLKPHLEMILWEVLEACQIRANEASTEFLLGFNTT